MTVALIAGLILTVAGFLVLLDRKDKRAHAEREQERRERADLLQRIQAPEVAVADHSVQGPAVMPRHVPLDDDQAHWEAQAEQGIDVAEALERMRQLEAEQAELAEFDARQA